MSMSTVGQALTATTNHIRRIYAPVVDDTINFDAPVKIIDDYNDSNCIAYFRFRKEDLHLLADLLWLRFEPLLVGHRECVLVKNRYQIPYETGLLIVLYRLSRPNRIRPDMERFFSMRKSKIAAILETFIFVMHEVALPYLSNPEIFAERWELLSGIVRQKSNNAVNGIWGFIDGTLRKTCRPSRFQRLAYSGHKRCHGIKFQSVVTPDGMFALLYGPIAGSRHDCFLLAQSDLVQQLRQTIPLDPHTNLPKYSLHSL